MVIRRSKVLLNVLKTVKYEITVDVVAWCELKDLHFYFEKHVTLL